MILNKFNNNIDSNIVDAIFINKLCIIQAKGTNEKQNKINIQQKKYSFTVIFKLSKNATIEIVNTIHKVTSEN